MKFTTILFSLAVVATTTNDNYGVHGMSDDMDNTTDTTAAASSDGEGGGFIEQMKKGWGQVKAGVGCLTDVLKFYGDNPDLEAAQNAWEKSAVRTQVKSEGENSWTFAYDMDLCKAFKEECDKVEGMTFTAMPDETLECEYYGVGNGNATATVATSGNGVCLADSDSCKAIEGGSDAVADSEMYDDLETIGGVTCKTLVSDDSGASTHVLGSLVAVTAVVAVTMLI